MNATLEVVKQSRQAIMEDAHFWRRRELRFGGGIWPWIQRMHKAGFLWTVDKTFLTKFAYHASLYERDRAVCEYHNYDTGLTFVGDIPEAALDRLELAKACGCRSLTIHSERKLDVVPMAKVDPVVLAWKFNPALRVRDGQILSTTDDSTLAFIVSVWDNDEELEL